MNFRALLSLIANRYGDRTTFTSRRLATAIGRPFKETSNGLRILQNMHFLSRKRVSRDCLTSSGKPCRRGYEYEYSINRQGLSYVRWLREGKPLKDATIGVATMAVLDHLPPDLRQQMALYELVRPKSKYRGPGSNRQLLDRLLEPKAVIEAELSRLVSENSSLAAKNNGLSLRNEFLESYNSRLEHDRWLRNGVIAWLIVQRNEDARRYDEVLKILRDQFTVYNNLEKLDDLNTRGHRILELESNLNRGSLDYVLTRLPFLLPKEATDLLMKQISQLEEPKRKAMRQQLDELKKDLKSAKDSARARGPPSADLAEKNPDYIHGHNVDNQPEPTGRTRDEQEHDEHYRTSLSQSSPQLS